MAAHNKFGKYAFLDHAAEVKFEAYGKSIDECFANAAQAVVQIFCDPLSLQVFDTKEITLEAPTLEALLYDFLSQIVVLVDADHFIAGDIVDVQITKGSTYKLKAMLHGQDTQDVAFDTDVKSITHHQLSIRQENGEFVITVVVDV